MVGLKVIGLHEPASSQHATASLLAQLSYFIFNPQCCQDYYSAWPRNHTQHVFLLQSLPAGKSEKIVLEKNASISSL